MRVPDSATAGIATVKLSFEGWPDGDVRPSVFEVPVVPRKAIYAVSTSPRQHAVWRLPEGWKVRHVSVAPNGRDVAVASMRRDNSGDTYRLALCEFPTGRVRYALLDLPPEKTLSHWIDYLAFSPGGRWLAVSVLRRGGLEKNAQGDDVEVRADRLFLIDLTNGKIAHRIQTDGFSILGLAFTPDGTKLATAQFSRVYHRTGARAETELNGDIRIWDVASGKQSGTFGAFQDNAPSHLAFAPDGKSLAVSYSVEGRDSANQSGSVASNFVRIFDPKDGHLQASLPERYHPQFVPGSSRLLLVRGAKGNLLIHDLQNQRDSILLTFPSPKRWLLDCQPAVDGRSALCSFEDGQMVLVELPSGKVLAQKETSAGRDPKRRCWCSAQSRDGRLFAAGEHTEPPRRMTDTLLEELAELPPSEIHIWDTKQLRRLATLTGHLGKIDELTFSRDGHWLLSGGADGTVRVWDLSDLAPNASIGQN